MTAFVVVNPKAARGWRKIRAALERSFPQMTVVETAHRGDAAALVRAALKEGHLDIVAVGGDGTLNEAVNGFFERGECVSPDAVLGFVLCGAHGDAARGLAAQHAQPAEHLAHAHIRRVDIGRVRCLSPDGAPVTRYFINAASLGLTAGVARAVNRARLAGLFGAGFAWRFHAARMLLGWRTRRLRLMSDTGYDEIAGITAVAVANGGWFAGGYQVAPKADPGDGFFDIAVMEGAPRRRILTAATRLAGGKPDPAIRLVRATRLTAAPTIDTRGTVEVETDGESAGVLPATFELLPSALKLRC